MRNPSPSANLLRSAFSGASPARGVSFLGNAVSSHRVVKQTTRTPNREAICAARRSRTRIVSDGSDHLGSALDQKNPKEFPGPKGNEGLPLRVLPIGGLGRIGMNCMLVGVYDRFVMVDAGLMFPDFTDVGMQKILPDTAFIAQWKDKIEALIITHGHEDHIGALPWVLPALDPSTPVYASQFSYSLIRQRLKQYNLWKGDRFHTFPMNVPFQLGPFECEALRVTHSIPDCCGLIFRSQHGSILHTGDWKIDEDPVDGRKFDRDTFEKLKKEKVTLMMSDSTNVLTPGRSISESVVREALIDKICSYKGKGRVVTTLFASNLHRMGSIKKAADASGRNLCLVGLSLGSYLNAATDSGDAPFDRRALVDPTELDEIDPNKLLVVTTGSQAEPQSALSLASQDMSSKFCLDPDDVVIYSAKVIPGNEKRVMKMMNRISRKGHGYKEELSELINLVQPQHFLPIHGESVFLNAHAELAIELGVKRTSVIHDGEMLGVKSLRSRRSVSSGSMQLLGDVDLTHFYNDGRKGTGTYREMAIGQRERIGTNGIVVVSVDVIRPPSEPRFRNQATNDVQDTLRARVRINVRAMWIDKGKLLEELFKVTQETIQFCPVDSSCNVIDRAVTRALRGTCRRLYHVNPDVIAVVHENDPRVAISMKLTSDERSTAQTGRRSARSKKSDPNRAEATSQPIPEQEKPITEEPDTTPLEKAAELLLSDTDTKSEEQEPSMEELLLSSPNGLPTDKPEPTTGSQPVLSRNAINKVFPTAVESQSKPKKKSTTGKRRGRPPKKAIKEETTSASDLIPVPEGMLEEREARNPRANPIPGADVEYG